MKPALILIDIEKGFLDPVWGERNNPDAEARAGELLNAWRRADAPVIHIRHVSVEPGSPLVGEGAEFQDIVAPLEGEPIFEKSVNSAFIGTGLEQHLRDEGITELVICGLTTPHCVSTTTRMAGNLGFGVTIPEDACAAVTRNADTSWNPGLPAPEPQDIHNAALSHLHGEFATVTNSDAVLQTLG